MGCWNQGLSDPREAKGDDGEGRSQDHSRTQAWMSTSSDPGRGQRLREYEKNEPAGGPAQVTLLLRGLETCRRQEWTMPGTQRKKAYRTIDCLGITKLSTVNI